MSNFDNAAWNKRRAKLQKALVEITLDLFRHTGANAFKVPIPNTMGPLFVVAGEFVEKAAPLASLATPQEQEQCYYCGKWYPKPVSYHHTEQECDAIKAFGIIESPEDVDRRTMLAEFGSDDQREPLGMRVCDPACHSAAACLQPDNCKANMKWENKRNQSATPITDALRKIANRHARDAVAPIGSCEHESMDVVVLQNIIRQEEIIFHALVEAADAADAAQNDMVHDRALKRTEWR